MPLTLSIPGSVATAPSRGMVGGLSTLGRMFARGLKAVQYARMLNVLSSLSEQQLGEIGLTRADLPRHAHECIYGDAA